MTKESAALETPYPLLSVTVTMTEEVPAPMGVHDTVVAVLEHPAGSPLHAYLKPPEPPAGTALVNVTGCPTSTEVTLDVAVPTVGSR